MISRLLRTVNLTKNTRLMAPVAPRSFGKQERSGINQDDSDEDFRPQEKVDLGSKSDKEILQEIDDMVKNNKVVLFMKGSPEAPQCGYSQFVAGALSFYKIQDYYHVDILRSPDIRRLAKTYSDWPTFPQLYVDGELVGGADIISEMHKDGSLKGVLDEVAED